MGEPKMNYQEQIKLKKLDDLTAGDFTAFLYDCDGTLADNMNAHKFAYQEVAAKYGIDLDLSLIDQTAGWPTVQVAAEISKRYNVVLPESFAAEKSAVFVEKYIANTKPVTFVLEHFKKNVSKVRIGVVTGGSRATVSKTLAVLGIDHLVEVLVCAGETPRGKPHPDPFLKAAQDLGVNPSTCMVFEDGNPGVQAAIAAGMKWIRVDQV
jgi:HAD superfamily hydrolase (TIGR01509 family)